MASTDIAKYFDERGRNVLAYEYQLRQLGLILEKTRVGELLPPGGSGGVLGLYDLKFKKTGDTFSKELVEFLTDKINLSPADIERLQQEAVLSSES